MTDVDDAQWPPTDPTAYNNHTFSLPSDPWTYENGSLNPDLQPSNSSRLRERSSTSRRAGATSSVPPYHPDFDEQSADEGQFPDSESQDDYWNGPTPSRLVRRGSEGYEVRPINREDMLRMYVEEQTHMQGRYNTYVPETSSGSDSASEDQAISEVYNASKTE
jgi:palmitoyltransferase ZDHHC6